MLNRVAFVVLLIVGLFLISKLGALAAQSFDVPLALGLLTVPFLPRDHRAVPLSCCLVLFLLFQLREDILKHAVSLNFPAAEALWQVVVATLIAIPIVYIVRFRGYWAGSLLMPRGQSRRHD